MPCGKKELAILKLRVLKSSWGEARPSPMAVKKIGVTEQMEEAGGWPPKKTRPSG